MPKLIDALKEKYKTPGAALLALGLDEHLFYDVVPASTMAVDSNPFITPEVSAMKMTKLGAALFAALCMASPVLAADSALGALVGPTDRKTIKRDELKGKLLALDASLDSNKLDAVLDAILDVEQANDPVAKTPPVAAEDESPADKLRALLAGKVDDATIESACALLGAPAEDEAEPGMKKEEVAAAMDGLRKGLLEAHTAADEVRPVVGKVLGMDSAADIYGFALDHLKVDRKGVEGTAALRALYRVASTKSSAPAPVLAADSATVEKQFPGLARFRNA